MNAGDKEALRKTAETLIGSSVVSVEQATGGGNSRIYKVIAGGKPYALKRYPVIEGDTRDRLGTERKALQFFAGHGITCTPRWIASAPPFALMEWIEGRPVTHPVVQDIREAVLFLVRIFELSAATPRDAMPAASEACTSGAEILSQVEKRLRRLQAIQDEPLLAAFLAEHVVPAIKTRKDAARTLLRDLDEPLPHDEQRLIPADFGFHNALRAPDNHLVFIDFEYFGWDDPVKVVCDFLLHPAMALDEPMRLRFYAAMMESLPAPARQRFPALYPLFGLRWTLILLNEFLPERWQARAQARGDFDADAARIRQLEKARAMLARSAAYEG